MASRCLSRYRIAPVVGAAVVLLVGLGLWLSPQPLEASSAAAEAAMRNQIHAILEDPARPNALWGIHVQNLATGRVVYSRNATHSFVPASNQKLLTSAVALETLGPDHRFTTQLFFDGQAQGDALEGDLLLRGSGDPTFGSALSTGSPLAHWARSLYGMGVRRVEGRIIGDDSAVAPEHYGSGWDIDYIATAHWAQAIGGLSYADNLVTVEIAGTRAGSGATVRTWPAGYVQLDNGLMTRGGRGFSPMRIDRNVGTNEVLVTGSVSPNYRGTVRLPIHDPTRFTLHAFVEHLRRAGIEVRAQLVTTGDLEEPPAFESEPILVHTSPPLIDMLTAINQRSNNFYAEQVFRSVGNGTTRGAAQRTLSYLQSAGVPTSGVMVRDGSGLSRKNFVTPAALGALLTHLYRSEHRDAYLGTLARGGQPNSTMRFRLGGTPVWAKTGTIEHVRALSGYVTGPDNTPYAFVLLANNYTASPAMIGQVQNDIVLALANGGNRSR